MLDEQLKRAVQKGTGWASRPRVCLMFCTVLYCTALQSRNEHVAKSKAPEFVCEFLLSFVKLAVGHCENEVFSLL